MDFELLKELCASFGVSGAEEEIRNTIKGKMLSLCDSIKTDEAGNLICVKYGLNKEKNIILDAHMDSIGFIVKEVFDNGFISFECIGGIDDRILPSQEVIIYGKEKVLGIVTSKPPHLQTKDENYTSSDKLFIDTGINKDIHSVVSVGDFISFKSNFSVLNNKYISSPYLDNRACVGAIIEIFSLLCNKKLDFNLTAVFSVGEEIGLKGSYFSKEKCNLCIVTDVTFAKTIDYKEDSAFDCGQGVAFGVGPNISNYYLDILKKNALKNNLSYQTEVLEGSSGTNAWAYQVGNNGAGCVLLSIPVKYMHTPVEMISINDYENLISHISSFLEGLNVDCLKPMGIYNLEENFE